MTTWHLPPLALRVVALVALGVYGAERWATIVAPAARTQMVVAGSLALAFGLGVRASSVLARGPRIIVVALGGLAVLLSSAWLFGVHRALLSFGRWPDLLAGLRQGVAGLPDASTPYAGVDPWPRMVILLGGAALLMAGCALALRRRAGSLQSGAEATVPLVALVAVPGVVLPGHAQVGQGIVLFLGLAALLWLDRVDRRAVLPAAGLLVVAALAGALAAPVLDRPRPWLDYQSLAGSLRPGGGAVFDWNHHYGPLNWPRDGSEVQRVRTRRPVFLKAQNLDSFDGLRWASSTLNGPTPVTLELPQPGAPPARWRQGLEVSIGNLSTRQVIGAGAILEVRDSPAPLLHGPSPGTWMTTRPLHAGDSYRVEVYAPHPSRRELVNAGTDYGTGYADFTQPYRQITLPHQAAGHAVPGGPEVVFPPFHTRAEPVVQLGNGSVLAATGTLLGSPYAATYALAQRLAARAPDPYEFVTGVQRYLQTHADYSEDAPRRDVPLASFLFRDHLGYCQQFAGAMALLLRMGGVPARVAAGFTPGTPANGRGERVVFDVDAHSWVEAWFPGYGWVTFDPTPGLALSVLGPHGVVSSLRGNGGAASASERAGDSAPRGGSRRASARAVGTGTIVGGLLILVLLAGAVTGGVALRRRRATPAAQRVDPQLAELERALRRAGRPPSPGTTLTALERRYTGSPEAAAYLRALAAARYGYAEEAPSPAQRRALRAELARGLGASGRIRALWALPPRGPRIRPDGDRERLRPLSERDGASRSR